MATKLSTRSVGGFLHRPVRSDRAQVPSVPWPIIVRILPRPIDRHDTRRPTEGLAAALQQAWLTRGPLAAALWPLAQAYAALTGVRRGMYAAGVLRPASAGLPVLVVGNVVAGGAGKTPVVMALVRHLQARGWRPGVISRGYGRQSEGCMEVLPQLSAAACGDEPLLIRQRCGVPVFVAARRIDAARALRAAHPGTDVLVSDDGLQHLALARTLNIVVFDDRGTGNGWLLPAGPLREPWPLRPPGRADLVLHSGQAPAFEGFRATRRLAELAVGAQGQSVPLSALQGRRIVALAAIARPEAFFDMLRRQGLSPSQTLALPDHHDLAELPALQDAQTTVLCTEKDAVKLFPRHRHAGDRLLAVPLEFTPEPAFFEALDQRLAGLRAPTAHPLPSTHGHSTS